MDIDRATTNGDDGAEEADKKGGRGCLFWVIVLLILAGGGAVTGLLVGSTIFREETPAPGEALIVDLVLKQIGVPGEFHDLKIPSADRTSDALAKGKQLFEVECAMCHGIGGRADADLGKLMYPPATDLTSDRTNETTDGQLFWMVAHGINLSGMPAWGQKYGGGNTDDEVWSMIAYIRTLRK